MMIIIGTRRLLALRTAPSITVSGVATAGSRALEGIIVILRSGFEILLWAMLGCARHLSFSNMIVKISFRTRLLISANSLFTDGESALLVRSRAAPKLPPKITIEPTAPRMIALTFWTILLFFCLATGTPATSAANLRNQWFSLGIWL
jgi:hypothetical protein